MNKKQGFTLIELLVVIAIIALLLSITMPALTKAKFVARRMVCGANIRSITTSLHSYAQSNKEYLPEQYSPKDIAMPWHSVIAFDGPITAPIARQLGVLYREHYIESPEAFYCPSQPRISDYPFPYYYDFYTHEGSVEWGSQLFESYPGHWPTRTSYNYWILGPNPGQKSLNLDKKVRLTKLSNEPLVFDNCQEWEMLPHKSNSSTPQGVMTAFSDGHVSFSKSERLFSDELWPKDFSRYMNGPGDDAPYFERILRELKQLQ